jgi:Flp pilus assembly pilin Flp
MFDRFNTWATALLAGSKDESGQTFVEYALVLSVLTVSVLIAAMAADLGGVVETAIGALETAIGGTP